MSILVHYKPGITAVPVRNDMRDMTYCSVRRYIRHLEKSLTYFWPNQVIEAMKKASDDSTTQFLALSEKFDGRLDHFFEKQEVTMTLLRV